MTRPYNPGISKRNKERAEGKGMRKREPREDEQQGENRTDGKNQKKNRRRMEEDDEMR